MRNDKENINNTSVLKNTTEKVLELARKFGASSAEVDIGSGQGLTVTVRLGEVETIEHQRDKGMSVTVYIGKQKSSANTTDFSEKALSETVQAACSIARYANEDECAGLLDPEYLANEVPDLDLYHPWNITPEQAINLAIECENEARNFDRRITNSDGTALNTYTGSHVYGNSNGFINGWNWSSHSIECAMIAEQDGRMQRDGWYSKARASNDLETAVSVGEHAAHRTISRLGARKLPTCHVPVIFEAPIARGLISTFTSAISGGALYRKASFLLDSINTPVFAGHIIIEEQPHLARGIGSAPFDNDGMATRHRRLIDNGILTGYILSAYSARKLKLPPTGNAGGVHNLIVEPGKHNLQELINDMHRGLLITDLIGFGVNNVTGDYSRGASGFWVENGEIQYPVEEITVAGNLADMYKQIIHVGNDVDKRGNIQTGSIMIEKMMVAGS